MARVTIATLLARIEKMEAAEAAQSAPVKAQAAEPTYYTGKDLAAGKGFPCSVTLKKGEAACVRLLKTSARASIHGTDDGGHAYRTA